MCVCNVDREQVALISADTGYKPRAWEIKYAFIGSLKGITATTSLPCSQAQTHLKTSRDALI